MRRPLKITTLILATLAYLPAAQAQLVFDLDFTGATVDYNSGAQSLVIDIEDVAVGTGAPSVDVRIESITPYVPDTPTKGLGVTSGGNNGTPTGTDDVKIHLDAGTATLFRLSLYNGGGEYTTLFDPGVDYSYSLVFYDLDGTTNNGDILRVYSPVVYTVTDTTDLAITTTATYVEFDGRAAGEVLGQDGLTSFTPEQEDVAVELEFTDLNQLVFGYDVVGGPSQSGRNLLFDGNDLTVNGTPVPFIPEPGTGALLVAAGLAVGCLRRRQRQ